VETDSSLRVNRVQPSRSTNCDSIVRLRTDKFLFDFSWFYNISCNHDS